MITRKRLAIGCLVGLIVCAAATAVTYAIARQQINLIGFISPGQQAAIQVPPGFTATIFAEGLNGPRFLAVRPDGVLYAADRRNGRIVTLPDANNDGTADEIRVFADGLDAPHSLAYHQGDWYVGVPSGVIRLTDADGDGVAESRTTLIDNFTPPGQHSTRTVAFLPDGRMLISAGSTCNVCTESDPRRAAITIYDNPTGQDTATGERIYASGLRNAVGLAIHPDTGELWASNNGRDLMGDDLPPENIFIVRDGANYGWPYCHSGRIPDPDMGNPSSCDGVEQPITEIQAHTAPLGIAFYTGSTFPADYHGDLFIALHGSWNRSEPVGYSVYRLPLDGSTPTGPAEPFATGWIADDYGTVNGRPVDVVVGSDGALYVSDDTGGFIYRIAYQP